MKLIAILETILFVHGEALTVAELASIAGVPEANVQTALNQLRGEYADRGFALLEKDGAFQLGSNPANASYVEALMKEQFSQELSRAALETLSVVAYKGPMTRVDIEYIRGVNSSFTLRNLLMRGLVERIENPKDARSYLYRVSFDFLKHLGFLRIEDLPGYQEFRSKKIEIPEDASLENKEIHE